MNDVLLRSTEAPLEITGDGRTIVGMLVPYNTPTTVDDGFGAYVEAVDRGAFQKVMRGNPSFVKLLLEHDGGWVGKGERWLDSAEGLRMSFRVDATEPGRTALWKVNDGQVPGLSVGYVPGRTVTRNSPNGPVEWRMTVKMLHHTALVPKPAYTDAVVTAVRSQSVESTDRLSEWTDWVRAHR